MTNRKLKTIQRLAGIRRRSLNESCQDLIQNETKLKKLIHDLKMLRQHQERVLSEQLQTNASLDNQVQTALWCTNLESRFAQQQKMIHDCQEQNVRLRQAVAQQHNEIKALEKYIEKLEHELLCEAQAKAASYADDLHLSQRQEGLLK